MGLMKDYYMWCEHKGYITYDARDEQVFDDSKSTAEMYKEYRDDKSWHGTEEKEGTNA
jgi:hypothetical protein